MNIYHYGHSNDDHSVYHQDKQVDGHCDDYDDDQDDGHRDDEADPICKWFMLILYMQGGSTQPAASQPPPRHPWTTNHQLLPLPDCYRLEILLSYSSPSSSSICQHHHKKAETLHTSSLLEPLRLNWGTSLEALNGTSDIISSSYGKLSSYFGFFIKLNDFTVLEYPIQLSQYSAVQYFQDPLSLALSSQKSPTTCPGHKLCDTC